MTITYSKGFIRGTIKDIKPVEIQMVRQTSLEPLWDELVRQYHYLGHRRMPGANLKYLAFCSNGSPVAALSFRAASLKLGPRDCFIGWSPQQRSQYLPQLANNNRFLILPWVRVKNLGSYLLSQITAQLVRDWFCYYEKQLLLLETFVDPRFFQGTVYKASGWVHVGSTLGYTRKGSAYTYHGHFKEVFLYPLRADFRSIIGCRQRPYRRPSIQSERSLDPMLLERVGWDPNIAARLDIDLEDVSKLTQKLVSFVEKFADCFQNKGQLFHAMAYLKGLASDLNAKSIEPIAIKILGEEKVRALQHFITGSPWQAQTVLNKSKEDILCTIAADDGMATLDSSETPKKGKHSAGVKRQYCGHLGKVENCQSGVFLGYASSKGYTMLEGELYMPEEWFADEYAELREETRVPAELTFQTKVEIASELLSNAQKCAAFTCRWVGMDSFFGKDAVFRDGIGEDYYYFADIPSNTPVWLQRPEIGLPPYKGKGPRPRKEKPLTDPIQLCELVKAPNLAWETVNLGEGAKGPILAEVACLRIIECREKMPGPECWLFLRKHADGKIKYAFSNAPADITKEELLRASTMRWSIEQLFQEGKSYLGMDHYEVRSYPGWHKHMALVILTMHFLLEVRLEFGEKKLYNAAHGTPAALCRSYRQPAMYYGNSQDGLLPVPQE